jgi:DNA-directed RNA polymerase specialized sigma24 family protein
VGFPMREDGPARASELDDMMTAADLKRLMTVVRSSVPAWCRRHEEFAGVAGAVIAAALRDFDPARGTFEARLAARARDRVARELCRNYSRPAELLAGDDVLASQTADRDPCAEVESQADLDTYLAMLPETERQVAYRLSEGFSQAEIAAWLGLCPRKVSRVVASLAASAEAFFDYHPRRTAG